MRKALSVFIAVCLVLSLCTGVLAPVPEARAAGPAVVDLGTAGTFVVLAKSGISTIGATSITGDIGVSPINRTGLTGFSETMDASNTFSTSTYVVAPGKLYASDYAPPTPATVGQAVYAMEAAYTDAANATTPTPLVGLGAGTLGNNPGDSTFYPNIYKWSTNVTIPNDITLSGGPNDVFIFQIDGTLGIDAGKKIILTGGAQAKNVFWQVTDVVTLHAGSHFEGNILGLSTIAMQNGASINGKLLSQKDVTLIGNAVGTTYTVTASVAAGSGTVTPLTQTVAQGVYTYTTVTITAAPGSWIATGGLVDSVDGVIAAANHLTSYTYTTTPITADRTIGATFEAIPIYTLTVNKVGNGTVTPATGTTYASGAVVPLTATPAAGYTFTGWSGDLSGATSPTTLTMNANKAVTATFAANSYANPYILTYTAGTNGTITGTTPQTVGYGASGTPVIAVPNAGYHFVSWSDNSTVNPRTDRNVTANKAVTATFAANPVTPLPNALGLNPLTLPLQICRESEIVVDESWTNGTAPFTWTVNFGDGTPVVTGSATDRRLVVRHLYAAEGSYTVNVAVTDSSGQVGSASHTLEAVICNVPGEVYHHTFFIGYPDGLFKPERNVSRAEVAAAVTRALGLGWSNTKPSYPDVPATHWSSGNIQIMKDEGIMIGDVSGTFRPDEFITRAEAATLLLRMLKVQPFHNLTSSSFKDVSATNWAIGYIESMQKYGLITGYPDGTYKPNAHILRSEFTAIADRALGREISKSSQVTGLGKDIRWPDVATNHWAYLYILEASTPHTVEQVNRLNRNIVLKSKTIPLLSDGTSAVTIRKVGDHLTAIVPVDGLLPNGSIPAARKVTVVITIKLKP